MLFKTISYPAEYMNIHETEVYGGTQLQISFNQRFESDIKWLRSHRDRIEKEEKLRSENPALHDSYEQYQTMLRLLLDLN